MTVCRYFLRGTCRFGDRCRFEHIVPENTNDSYSNSNYSNRKQDYGYQDSYRSNANYQGSYRPTANYQGSYRPTANYQDRSYGYQNHDLSFGPRRFDNSEKRNQNHWSNNYYDSPATDDSNFYQDYGRYSSNQRYSSPERQYSSNRFDSQQKNQSNKGYYSNRHESNKYEWISEDYQKKQKPPSYQQPSLYSSFESNDSFSFKDSKFGTQNDEVNEENMILIERIKEDITSWELGSQWPFTCYAPFPKKGDFPGFCDISFEELRYASLKAQENHSFDLFVENVSKAIIDVQSRRNELKEPTPNLLSIIEKLNSGEHLTDNSVSNALLSGFSITNSALDNSVDIADDSFNNQGTIPSSTFSFKTSLPTAAVVRDSASSFSFKTALDSAAAVKDSATTFSFKTALDQSNHMKSTLSSFSFKETAKIPTSTISDKTNDGNEIYTSINKLSEQDKEQFYASTFTLGKIPTLPPPKVLCF